MFGVALLVDPWDIAWNSVRLWVMRIFTDQREQVVWDLTVREVLVRVMQVPWAAAVLSVATVGWWSPWILLATVPAALGTMTYAVLGRNRYTSTSSPLCCPPVLQGAACSFAC